MELKTQRMPMTSKNPRTIFQKNHTKRPLRIPCQIMKTYPKLKAPMNPTKKSTQQSDTSSKKGREERTSGLTAAFVVEVERKSTSKKPNAEEGLSEYYEIPELPKPFKRRSERNSKEDLYEELCKPGESQPDRLNQTQHRQEKCE